jgi:hypothetical protein
LAAKVARRETSCRTMRRDAPRTMELLFAAAAGAAGGEEETAEESS